MFRESPYGLKTVCLSRLWIHDLPECQVYDPLEQLGVQRLLALTRHWFCMVLLRCQLLHAVTKQVFVRT